MGYCAPTSPPESIASSAASAGARPSAVSPRIDRSMTLLLAAVGAVVAALFELTVGAVSPDRRAQPTSGPRPRRRRHDRRRARSRARLGLRGRARTRCPGTATARIIAFALLLCVGGASVLGHVLRPGAAARPDRRRLRPEPRVLDDPVRRRRRARRPRSRWTTRCPSSCPSAIYDAVLAGLIGPLAIAIHDRRVEAGAGRLVSAYLDGHPASPRERLSRFLVFGLGRHPGRQRADRAAVLPPGRQRRRSTPPSPTANRTVLESIPSPRGLIYDRNGRALVTNVPTFAVKIRPADLPLAVATEVVDRLAALIGMDPADINAAIDSNPGSRSTSSGSPRTSTRRRPGSSPKTTTQLPGRRGRRRGAPRVPRRAAVSQLLGYTGRSRPSSSRTSGDQGYLPDDLIGKAGVEAAYETSLRGTYGAESVERDARGRKIQVLATVSDAQPGTRSTDHRHEGAEGRREGAQWGWSRRHQARRGHRHEPADRRGPGDGQPADLRQQPVRARDQQRGLPAAAQEPGQAAAQPRGQAQYPPGSTYKLVTGTGGLADGKITADTKIAHQGLPDARRDQVLRLEPRGFGPCDIYCGFGHSSDTFFFQSAGMLGHRPARLLGQPVRLRRADRDRPAGRGLRHRPDEPVEAGHVRRRRSSPARPTRRASARATTS